MPKEKSDEFGTVFAGRRNQPSDEQKNTEKQKYKQQNQ